MSYAIIHPTVIFGKKNILINNIINNIARLLRRCPVFARSGIRRLPAAASLVDDVAEEAISAAHHHDENILLDAAGHEMYSFNELVRLIADKVRNRAKIIHLRPGLALFLSRLIGWLVSDAVLTQDEVEGLMSNLLVSGSAPRARTRLSDCLSQNADRVGTRYASELERHYR